MLMRQRLALTGILLGLAGVVACEVVWIATAGSGHVPVDEVPADELPVDEQPASPAASADRDGDAPGPLERPLLGASLEGFVTDVRGQPVPDALVEAVRQEPGGVSRRLVTRCDQSGRFVLDGLTASEYRLRVRAEGYLANSKGSIRMPSSSVRKQLDFVLESTDGVSGLVTSRTPRRNR